MTTTSLLSLWRAALAAQTDLAAARAALDAAGGWRLDPTSEALRGVLSAEGALRAAREALREAILASPHKAVGADGATVLYRSCGPGWDCDAGKDLCLVAPPSWGGNGMALAVLHVPRGRHLGGDLRVYTRASALAAVRAERAARRAREVTARTRREEAVRLLRSGATLAYEPGQDGGTLRVRGVHFSARGVLASAAGMTRDEAAEALYRLWSAAGEPDTLPVRLVAGRPVGAETPNRARRRAALAGAAPA